MNLRTLINAWHPNTPYPASWINIYRTYENEDKFRTEKKFMMRLDYDWGLYGVSPKLLDNKVLEFSVSEDELKVIIDIHQKEDNKELLSASEFYRLIDKSCIELNQCEHWLEDMKDDEKPRISRFEINYYSGKLVFTTTYA